MDDDSTFRASFRRFARELNKTHARQYFLADGTLLGFVRDNDFICGDRDIDIGMLAEHYDSSVVDSAARAGFVLVKRSGSRDDGLSLNFHNGTVQIDLILYYATDKGRQCNAYQRGNRIRYSYPPFTLEPAVFQGMPIMIPGDPERIIRAQYGPSWRTPTDCWSYAFSPENAEPDGHLPWRWYFAWRRSKLKLRQISEAAGLVSVSPERPVLPPVQQRNNVVDTGIVFTDGVFDMLHTNHVKMLEDARRLGEHLVVGVATDELATSYKRKPVIGEQARLHMVQSLTCVDEAFLLSGPLDAARMRQLLARYQPRKVVYAGAATPDFYAPAERAKIMVRPVYRDGTNSSAIIKSIQTRQDLK